MFTGVKTSGMDMKNGKEKVIGFNSREASRLVVFVSEKEDLEKAKAFVKHNFPKSKISVNKTIRDFIPS